MNFAFELQKDKGLRDDNPLQPFKIVSLWEVLDFYAEKFANICRILAELCTAPIDNNYERIRLSRPILDELNWLHDTAKNLELKGPAISIERFLRDLRSKKTSNTQIRRNAHVLAQRIIDDFKGDVVFHKPIAQRGQNEFRI
jgi:hypothetical protein